MNGQGFALYHADEWVEPPSPTLALVVSHDGEASLYGVKGRCEKYLFGGPSVRLCGEEPVVVLGLSWRRSADGQVFAVTFDPASRRNWIEMSFSFQALGGAKSVSLPTGGVTSNYQIAGGGFFDEYYLDLEAWQLRANVEKLLALCAE